MHLVRAYIQRVRPYSWSGAGLEPDCFPSTSGLQSSTRATDMRKVLLPLLIINCVTNASVNLAAGPATGLRYDVMGTGQDCREGYKRTGTVFDNHANFAGQGDNKINF